MDVRFQCHICPFCNFSSRTLPEWFSHLRLVHSNEPNFSVTCGIDGCMKTYKKFSSLNSHVYRHHKQRIQEYSFPSAPVVVDTFTAEVESSVNSDVTDDFSEPIEDEDGDLRSEYGSQAEAEHALVKRNSALFILKLKEGRGVSQVTVDSVIEGCELILEKSLQSVQLAVKQKLTESGLDSSILQDIEDLVTQVPRPFEDLKTKYRQEKFFIKEFGMIEPIEKQLGETLYQLRGSGSKRRRVMASDHFYYVPVLDTLIQLLSKPDILNEIETSHISSDEMLRDFCDGEVYSNHPVFSQDSSALQIIPYFDELEICNPLGSSAKKHKLGLFFFMLGNIHPQYRSALKFLFLFAVAKASDIKKYGIDAILAPFVKDLNKLGSSGIDIQCSAGPGKNFKGALLAFLGDNLASHAIGGFKESMSFAFRFSRSCMATRDESHRNFTAAAFQSRTPSEHETYCSLVAAGPLKDHYSTTYGINRRSILNDVKHFSVVLGLPHDIMHDLLEGAFSYEIKAIFVHCATTKYFSIATLNERIQSFDFGYSESANKPALIDENAVRKADSKLHQSASQRWLLARTLPILVGDLVPADDQHWKCFTLLLDILDICTSQEISPNSVAYLTSLVEEHHILFCKLYPHITIKPKHHYMVHYPDQIMKFGPIIRSWTMRYESKLKFCKQVSKFGNLKNVCLSVAQKHQRWLCYQMQTCSFLNIIPEVGGHNNIVPSR